jgi:hypothetical protein
MVYANDLKEGEREDVEAGDTDSKEKGSIEA